MPIEELRKFDVPMDTEPATTFRPYLPGKQPAGRSAAGAVATQNAKLAIARPPRVQVASSLEDLAFEPVTVLASLVEARKVTSTDLTRMYLGRLKRYGDQLHCVVTLTEELALQQAAAADRDTRSGRYRGPLHGIPWGAKPYESRIAGRDATIVERLRDAGAVLVAKLSMGALAQGGVWFGGSTRNPWSPETSSTWHTMKPPLDDTLKKLKIVV